MVPQCLDMLENRQTKSGDGLDSLTPCHTAVGL